MILGEDAPRFDDDSIRFSTLIANGDSWCFEFEDALTRIRYWKLDASIIKITVKVICLLRLMESYEMQIQILRDY